MKSFTMIPSPTIVFGEGETANLRRYLEQQGVTKAGIVYDRGVFNAGLVAPILEKLGDFPYITCDKIEPESPDTAVQAVRDALYGQGVDGVVAIGGGSCIDTARTAMLLSDTDEPVTEFFTRFPEHPATYKKYICIPTTAGTGAEMSPGGPILNTKTNVKGALFCGFKMSDLVILDPLMTLGLPPFTTYTCACDALCHAIEAMTGNLRGPMTDMIAGQAVKYAWEAIPVVMDENPQDTDARGKLQLASNMAIGCQSLRHLGHAVCQPIGGRYHLAHGYTCALVLPAFIDRLADVEEIAPEWNRVCDLMGIDAAPLANDTNGDASANAEPVGVAASDKFETTAATRAHKLASTIWEMNRRYGISPLADKGITYEDALACTDQILADGRLLPNCPKTVTREDVEAVIYGMVYGDRKNSEA